VAELDVKDTSVPLTDTTVIALAAHEMPLLVISHGRHGLVQQTALDVCDRSPILAKRRSLLERIYQKFNKIADITLSLVVH
jgi:hypothetical protein